MSFTITIPIRQQDGSTVTLRYPNTVHNRLFAEFVRAQEPFNHRPAPIGHGEPAAMIKPLAAGSSLVRG